jgi:hypothetical protein
MSESIANGISITNSCYECQVIETKGGLDTTSECYECGILAQAKALGYPAGVCQTCADKAMLEATNYEAGKCATCLKNDESNADDNAHNLHEDERLAESGKCMSIDTSDAPSASEWVASQTYVRPAGKKAIMFEKWDDDNPFRLVELSVEFIDEDEPQIRYEFLPPIAQLQDGGVYEELWELQDTRQRAREIQCHWCNLLVPKHTIDCTSCDMPLEGNVR